MSTSPTTNWGNTNGTIWWMAIYAELFPMRRAAIHEVRLLALQNFGANDASEVRPMRNRHANSNAPKAFAERIGNKHEQDDMGHAHHEVDKPTDHSIDLRPQSAAAAPKITAITEDTHAATKPSTTLVERPESVRASMSRPIQSVPNG